MPPAQMHSQRSNISTIPSTRHLLIEVLTSLVVEPAKKRSLGYSLRSKFCAAYCKPLAHNARYSLIHDSSTTHSASANQHTYSLLSRAREEMELGILPEIEVLYAALQATRQCTHNLPSTKRGTYRVLSRASEEMELGMLPEIKVLYAPLHATTLAIHSHHQHKHPSLPSSAQHKHPVTAIHPHHQHKHLQGTE